MSRPDRRTEGDRPAQSKEAGFTLLELSIVLLIMAVVLVIAGTGVISLTRAANRNDATIQEEQTAAGLLAQMSRDIRSGHSLSFPTGADPNYELELSVNTSSGGTTDVKWVYSATASSTYHCSASQAPCLTRIENGNLNAPVLYHVKNAYSTTDPSIDQPIFSYYNDTGGVATGTATDVAECASRIHIDIYVGSTTHGVANFEVSDDVALTDQLGTLQAGTSQCAVS